MSEGLNNAQTGLCQHSDSFSSKERSLLASPGLWAWFHRLLGAKTNRLQTDKGSLRSQDVGSSLGEAQQEEAAPGAQALHPHGRGSLGGLQALLPGPHGSSLLCANSSSSRVIWGLLFLNLQRKVLLEKQALRAPAARREYGLLRSCLRSVLLTR